MPLFIIINDLSYSYMFDLYDSIKFNVGVVNYFGNYIPYVHIGNYNINV